MKIAATPHAFCAHIFASMLLLSSCGGGSSSEGDLTDDDCTPTTNLSTTLQTEVDINGNVSLVPVSNNTVSGCGSSTESDGTIELTDSITTRFKSSEDFDVWECDTQNGANVYYALFEKWNYDSWKHFGLEIGPVDSPLPDSQSVLWKASNADTLLISVPEQGIEIEWTNISFPNVDTMSANSAARGALQCTLKTVDNNGEGLFGFDVVLSSLAAGSDGTVELTSRMQTEYEASIANTSLEYWLCWAEDGSLLRYTFFDSDYPYAPSSDEFYYYGIEDFSGIDFFWRATSADSLMQELNEQGNQFEWTDIRFPDSDNLTANSTRDGALRCSLENPFNNANN